jgi:hypothetical protein
MGLFQEQLTKTIGGQEAQIVCQARREKLTLYN